MLLDYLRLKDHILEMWQVLACSDSSDICIHLTVGWDYENIMTQPERFFFSCILQSWTHFDRLVPFLNRSHLAWKLFGSKCLVVSELWSCGKKKTFTTQTPKVDRNQKDQQQLPFTSLGRCWVKQLPALTSWKLQTKKDTNMVAPTCCVTRCSWSCASDGRCPRESPAARWPTDRPRCHLVAHGRQGQGMAVPP